MRDAILTCYLTGTRDPARGKRWRPLPDKFAALRRSVVSRGYELVVLNDCFHRIPPPSVRYVSVPRGGNPYFYRWQIIADQLDRSDYDRVWCVDATDVVMLHDPFLHMRPGIIYTGSEPRRLGGPDEHNAWLRDNHPNYAAFCDAHTEQLFLNPGILGGDADDVAQVARQLADATCDDMTDMGAWQAIAHSLGDRIDTGHPIHTEYRAMDHTDPIAWWAHK